MRIYVNFTKFPSPFPVKSPSFAGRQSFPLTKPVRSDKIVETASPKQVMMGRRRGPSRAESRWLVQTGAGDRAHPDPGAVRLNRKQ